MVATSYIDGFRSRKDDSKDCINCGICLQKCPVMQMEKSESKAEMKRLLAGEAPKRVLAECTFCFSCNHYCPQGLRPYALIMERMTAQNAQSGQGIPEAVHYMCTGKSENGYFFDIYNNACDEDKAILARWQNVPPASSDTLFIGCTGRTMPQGIEHSQALSGLAKFAPQDACCGEIPYRFGDYETFSQTVARTQKQLLALDTERLICYCGSCSNYFGKIWPEYHGASLPFQVISLWEWLWEKYQNGELEIKKPLGKKVVLIDSCYASELGDGFFEAVRGLHAAAGMQIVELANNRYDSLCCGFASGIRNNYDPAQVEVETRKKMEQITAAAVKEVSCYCPGCWVSINKNAEPAGLKVHYAVNMILRAFGDQAPIKN